MPRAPSGFAQARLIGRQAQVAGAAALPLLILWSHRVWSGALIEWQIAHLGWYFATATVLGPVLVSLMPLALLLARWAPGGRASPMRPARLLGVLALGAALVAGWLACPPGGGLADAAPRRLRMADLRLAPGRGPIELIDGRPDRRIIVLDQLAPGFAARSAFVMMRNEQGRPSPVFVELAPMRPEAAISGNGAHKPQPADWSAPGRGGYRIGNDLPVAAWALIARASADKTLPPPVVLMRDRAAAHRAGLVAALQALLFALVLGLAAGIAAWHARRFARD